MRTQKNKGAGKTALFVGRFQPFHLGHARIAKNLLRRYPSLVIGIGSRRQKRTGQNPFSAQERRMLIVKTLAKAEGAKKRVRFAYLEDYRKDEDWAKEVRRRFSPRQFVAYSGNGRVLRLLKDEGFDIHEIKLLERGRWQGKMIRKRMAHAREWKKDLPAEIRDWMEKKGLKIIRDCDRAKRME